PGSAFLRPDLHMCIAGARRSGQGWARVSAHRRLVLEGFEHDGTLEHVGDDDVRGELRVGARSIVPHPCMRWARGPDDDAVMRIAASSEAADPFLTTALKPCGHCGTPPPRTVIGDPSEAFDRGRNRQVFLDRGPPLMCRTEDDAFRHDAIAD